MSGETKVCDPPLASVVFAVATCSAGKFFFCANQTNFRGQYVFHYIPGLPLLSGDPEAVASLSIAIDSIPLLGQACQRWSECQEDGFHTTTPAPRMCQFWSDSPIQVLPPPPDFPGLTSALGGGMPTELSVSHRNFGCRSAPPLPPNSHHDANTRT